MPRRSSKPEPFVIKTDTSIPYCKLGDSRTEDGSTISLLGGKVDREAEQDMRLGIAAFFCALTGTQPGILGTMLGQLAKDFGAHVRDEVAPGDPIQNYDALCDATYFAEAAQEIAGTVRPKVDRGLKTSQRNSKK